MEQAKAAINKFTSNRGHTTTVEESVQPAVTREVIKPHRHEEVTQAVDREVHQHHYHTTVQPLQHKEVLPEKHVHNVLPVEQREFRHENEEHTKAKLNEHLGHFTDTQRVESTRTTQAAAGTVTGEHVHHHVHETVVPVVHKETIQPEVVHTTVPVHETHIAASQHHGLSALPMKTLDEFTRAGGKLTGGSHGAHEEYEGQPRQYNDKLTTTFEKLGLDGQHHSHTGTTSTTGTTGGLSSGSRSGGLSSGNQNTQGYSSGHHHGAGAGIAGAGVGAAGVGAAAHHRRRGSNSSSSSSDESVGGTRRKKDKLSRRAGAAGGLTGNGTSGSSTSRSGKPSLLDRLNPMKDTDGDGKKGVGE